MKLESKWITKKIKYDGRQMHSLYAYLHHQVPGDSVIAFRGPCEVDFSEMLDGEDLLEKSAISGSDMVHFIFEIFHEELLTGVLLQRLFAAIVADVVLELSKGKFHLIRSGDDLYLQKSTKKSTKKETQKRKFSISIAAKSNQSVMLHFAVNVSEAGTPVPTIGLLEMKIEPSLFAKKCLQNVAQEFADVQSATRKVRPLR